MLREKGAQKPDVGPGAAGKPLQVPQIVPVHGDNQVKLLQILAGNLPGPGVQFIAAPGGGFSHAAVGPLAAVVIGGAGGIDAETVGATLPLHIASEHAFPRRRAADVA